MTVCFRLKVRYVNPEQKKHPVQGIYICNHIWLYDGMVMRTVFRKLKMYSLVTTDWMEKKWARFFLFYDLCIPVDRENPGTQWIHEARKVLKEGGSINIFPEGHTSKSEEVDTFKPGFLMLASLAKDIPIIPVATIGMYKFFFGERKRVLVGEPIYIDKEKFSLDPEKQNAYAAEFRQIILDMKQQLFNERDGKKKA